MSARIRPHVCIVALASRGHGSHDARIMGGPRTCADPRTTIGNWLEPNGWSLK